MIKRSLKIDFLVKDCSTRNYLIDEGFLPLGKVPSRNFIPDFSKLVSNLDGIYALGDIVKNMDDSQHRILLAALYYSSRLAKFNLHFAQPVYFNVSCPRVEYVDCWYKGYAVMADRKRYKDHLGKHVWDYTVIVISSLKGDYEVTFHLHPSSLLTKEQFFEHKKRLIDEGKIRAPKINLGIFHQKWEDLIDESRDAGKIKDSTAIDKQRIKALDRDLTVLFGKKRKKKKTRRRGSTTITIINQAKKKGGRK